MQAASRPRKPQIPLTILTGRLGAGKTTLLNRLIKDERFAATAVIVNEPGEVAIESKLVERADDGIFALSGGCVCCTARGELVDALERLLRALDNGRIAAMNRVVIETAGNADPIPILYLVARHPYLSLRFRLDGIVTVVDAERGIDTSIEAAKQVATADRIVISKGTASRAEIAARVRRLNPPAPILAADDIATVATAIIGAFDPPKDGTKILGWLGLESLREHEPNRSTNSSESHFSAFTIVRDAAMPDTALYDFLDRLVLENGSKLIQFKGLIATSNAPGPALVHGIGGLFSPPVSLVQWPDSDHHSRIAIIGYDLDRRAVEKLFDAFLGGSIDTPDREAILANPLAIPGFRAR